MEFKTLSKENFEEYIPHLIDLHESCFTQPVDSEYFLWRYMNNPVDDLLVCVAIDKGKVIANYAVSPCILLRDNKEIKSALSLNTMTHPDYRGLGLFTSLAAKLYEYMKENEYEMVWGFPNYLSHRTFISKLQWKDIYEIPMMILETKNIKDMYGVKWKTDNSFTLDYSEVQMEEKLISVKRSREYLHWRYYLNPLDQYTNFVIEENSIVTSYMIVKKYKDLLNIIDIQYKNCEQAEELLRCAVDYSITNKLDYITVWAPTHISFHNILEKYRFKNNAPVTYFGGRVLFGEEESLISSDYVNWFIQLGDDNVY